MNYAEALLYLDELNTFGISLGARAHGGTLCASGESGAVLCDHSHCGYEWQGLRHADDGCGYSVRLASVQDVISRRISSPIRSA